MPITTLAIPDNSSNARVVGTAASSFGITVSSRKGSEKIMSSRASCAVRMPLQRREEAGRRDAQQQEQCGRDQIEEYVVPRRAGRELARLQQIGERPEHADERRILGCVQPHVADARQRERAAAGNRMRANVCHGVIPACAASI